MSAQLKAAQSYWTSKRDEAAANLDTVLNKPVAYGNPQAEINELLRQFAEASNTLTTINLILQQAQQQFNGDSSTTPPKQ